MILVSRYRDPLQSAVVPSSASMAVLPWLPLLECLSTTPVLNSPATFPRRSVSSSLTSPTVSAESSPSPPSDSSRSSWLSASWRVVCGTPPTTPETTEPDTSERPLRERSSRTSSTSSSTRAGTYQSYTHGYSIERTALVHFYACSCSSCLSVSVPIVCVCFNAQKQRIVYTLLLMDSTATSNEPGPIQPSYTFSSLLCARKTPFDCFSFSHILVPPCSESSVLLSRRVSKARHSLSTLRMEGPS